MSSNAALEFLAIKKVLEDKNPQLLVAVSPDYFGNGELRKIFLLLRKYYTEHSEFISFDTLKALVAKACTTAEKTKFMLMLLDQIANKDVSGLHDEVLLKELQDFHKFRLILGKAQPLIDAVAAKDVDQALGNLKELYDSVFLSSLGSDNRVVELSEIATEEVKYEFYGTGLKPIDERGGLIKSGYTIIAAPAKTGKSTLAGMFGLHHYLHEGLSVFYQSLEMGRAEVRSRIFANCASVDIGNLLDGNLSDEEKIRLFKTEAAFYCLGTEELEVDPSLTREEFFEYVFTTYERRPNKFFVCDEPFDWDELWAHLTLMVTTKGVKTIIIDYPWLVSRGRAHKELASWEYNLLQSKNIKSFARKYGVQMICPAQLDKGKKGDDPKLRFVSNAINDCDLALYLVNTEEDKTLDTVTVKWGAARNFKTVPGKPYLEDFKLQKELNFSRFSYIDF